MLLQENLDLGFGITRAPTRMLKAPFAEQLAEFREFGKTTKVFEKVTTAPDTSQVRVPTYVNEFWTSKQRAASSLHEISYRACFKPQLPRFFIERLTDPGDAVYDPFLGRGTTIVEAALLGRAPVGCDINPLSRVLCAPRLAPPTIDQVERALDAVDFDDSEEAPRSLRVFYHRDTLRQITALRKHLMARERAGRLTPGDAWVRMVAVNRLTGHSAGFFSVYT